jgi:ribosome modulation factor
MTNPADDQAAEGRQTGRLGRPLNDCPAGLSGELRRAWRAGWRLGHEERAANRAVVEARIRAYGRGAPRRAA